MARDYPSSLGRAILRGTFWLSVSQVFAQGIQFAALVILTHILEPEDFGLLAICFAVTGIIVIFVEIGLPNALVQAGDLTPLTRSSVSWVCFLSASLFAVCVIATAPLIASFFKANGVIAPLRVLSVGMVINSLAVVPNAGLRRALMFKEVSAGDVGQALFYFASAVPVALSGFGVWSLVVGELCGGVARLVILTVLFKERPLGTFSYASLKPLLSFGLKNASSSFFHSARYQTDVYFVGSVLGARMLGGYNIVKRIITVPQRKISSILMKVCFPGFSRIQDDDEDIRRIYGKVISTTAFVSFPLLAYIAANAGLVISVVFGVKWLFIENPLRIFCLAGAVSSVATFTGSIILAKGRAGTELKLSIIGWAGLVLCMLVTVRYGLTAVSVGYLIYFVLASGYAQYLANRLIGLGTRRFLLTFAPATITAVAVGATARIADWISSGLESGLARMAVSAAAAFAVYCVFAATLKRNDLVTVSNYIGEKLGPVLSAKYVADIYTMTCKRRG